jgi:ribA/ribD-fused uncharacterized protein
MVVRIARSNQAASFQMNKIAEFRNEFFFLSNFYPIDLTIDGKRYASSEHYYQACKALDLAEHDQIRYAPSPAAAKKEARKIKSFRYDWDTYRIKVMEKALRAKFANPEMRAALLMTENLYLEEGNWWNDTFWGVCRGVGHNHLGKMLMKIREEIKNEASVSRVLE